MENLTEQEKQFLADTLAEIHELYNEDGTIELFGRKYDARISISIINKLKLEE